MDAITLLQFHYSPYNEKARWALDLKRVPHIRRSLLPGPHAPALLLRTRQTAAPALGLDGRWIAGSAAIVAALDARYPTSPLVPNDAAVAATVRDLERRFDDDLVPRMRRVLLATAMTDPDYIVRIFGEGHSSTALKIYRALFPVTRVLIAKGNGIDGPAAIEDGKRACTEALDLVAERGRSTGYLVGERFSTADLAAAAGLAMVFPPPGSPMEPPGRRPAATEELSAAWRGHPGLDWLGRIYREHRPSIRDFDGPSPY